MLLKQVQESFKALPSAAQGKQSCGKDYSKLVANLCSAPELKDRLRQGTDREVILARMAILRALSKEMLSIISANS